MIEKSEEFFLSKARFEAFSDGVFAIAITLLILEIHLPSTSTKTPTQDEQLHALLAIWRQYLVYAATFATIGIMWLNHHAMFRYVKRITHGTVAANLLLLVLISFLPFSTEVLARFGLSRPAVVFYGLTLVGIALAYTLVRQQVVAAHPASGKPFTVWNVVGMTFYPIATIVGYFYPVAAVVLIGLLALFYMLPSNVRAAAIRP